MTGRVMPQDSGLEALPGRLGASVPVSRRGPFAGTRRFVTDTSMPFPHEHGPQLARRARRSEAPTLRQCSAPPIAQKPGAYLAPGEEP